MTHPHPNRRFVPQAVLTKSSKINTAGASVNTVVRLFNIVGSKTTVNHPRSISNVYKKGYSQVTRPFNKYSANKNSIFNKKVNIVRVKDITARDRVVVSENRATTAEGIMMVDLFPLEMVKYNLFSVSQICDKKNNVLFTDTECLVLSSNFKLLDENQVLLRVPRKDNIYSVDLKSVVPTKGLTCLFAKAIIDESNLWHRRLGHINFKNMNKLVRGNLVRVVTDDFSRFSWVFFLATKDETSGILKTFITEIENQLDHKVKVIRCDNGTEFKNSVMNQFCEMKGIKREFSVARTPQQNGVAERKNRTLIEAARTMLVDSKLPTTFWAKAVNIACYVLKRVLIIKPHNKTPYELIRKFDGKADEGFFVSYFVVSKAMRVFNKRTRIVEETLNIRFLENAPNVIGNGLDWLFDVDSLTISMNYVLVVAGTQTKGPKDSEEDSGMKPIEEDVSRALDKDGKDDQATRNIPVNAAKASNTFEEHLFEQFSPFKNAFTLPPISNVTPMDDTGIFGNAYDDEDVGAEADLNNLETTMNVSPIPTTRIEKDHPKDQIIGDFNSAIQTRRMTKISDEHAMKVWTLVNLPNGKRAIGTKWVFRNKKDKRGIVVRNKARLVTQGYTQEEGIDYDEVFAPVARIEAIRLFLAYTSFMGFIVYQMDVKNAFLYGIIEEEDTKPYIKLRSSRSVHWDQQVVSELVVKL
ncbi:putative ribonuclease H-like domain-containing protein [Tanacetum coccineum]